MNINDENLKNKMTVKELKDLLSYYNDDEIVFLEVGGASYAEALLSIGGYNGRESNNCLLYDFN